MKKQLTAYLTTVYFVQSYIFKRDGKSIWFQLNPAFRKLSDGALRFPQLLADTLDHTFQLSSNVSKVDITLDIGGSLWCNDTEDRRLFKSCLADMVVKDELSIFKDLFGNSQLKVA